MTTIESRHFNLIRLISFAFIVGCATAQPSTDPNGFNYGNNINPSVGIIIIALVAALFLLGFFSMYIRHCSGDNSSSYGPTLRVSANQAGRSRRGPRGLDAAVIESFPTFDYSAVKSLHIGKGALECAVCLNEFQDDETLRLIPKCDHVFHPECIDAWLASHTTCPVCRAELTLQPGESVHAPNLGPIDDPVVIDVVSPPDQCETERVERPLNPAPAVPAVEPPVPGLDRSRTGRNASGRPGWLGVLFTRSNSTGHVVVKARWENMERFTLRLPEEVRSRIISESLNRNASSSGALPRQASSRRGYRGGPGGLTGPGCEGSSRGRRFGSWRFDRAARSDRWGFSLAPPFFTRGPSVRSPKVAGLEAAGGGEGASVHSSKPADSVHAATSSESNLPPV